MADCFVAGDEGELQWYISGGAEELLGKGDKLI